MDVTISYNNSTITTMSASGTEILETDGTYMADDITIEYTKPTASLQNKTVSPTTSSQSVTADSGYDGLGTVTVSAISPTKSAQTYTPTTSNQTIASGRWLTGTQTILGDQNLTAGNIKKDVSIFNVTGTYEGSGGGAPYLVAVVPGKFIAQPSVNQGGETVTVSYIGTSFMPLPPMSQLVVAKLDGTVITVLKAGGTVQVGDSFTFTMPLENVQVMYYGGI